MKNLSIYLLINLSRISIVILGIFSAMHFRMIGLFMIGLAISCIPVSYKPNWSQLLLGWGSIFLNASVVTIYHKHEISILGFVFFGVCYAVAGLALSRQDMWGKYYQWWRS
ncbi:hypothetical protein [Spartinivicinus poritis]|uniref:Uncharacterized protein n=1 Tax=Spartinivicinus poritis TaxID=2994640 RepID=A0ABT5UGI0_9GAMM|nr:hypothetical protein [Spartinivicinus sp. A2-2]MDE1465315.1 hypothetical protein [Spartinivicinus sp. A2-2]